LFSFNFSAVITAVTVWSGFYESLYFTTSFE